MQINRQTERQTYRAKNRQTAKISTFLGNYGRRIDWLADFWPEAHR